MLLFIYLVTNPEHVSETVFIFKNDNVLSVDVDSSYCIICLMQLRN